LKKKHSGLKSAGEKVVIAFLWNYPVHQFLYVLSARYEMCLHSFQLHKHCCRSWFLRGNILWKL